MARILNMVGELDAQQEVLNRIRATQADATADGDPPPIWRSASRTKSTGNNWPRAA